MILHLETSTKICSVALSNQNGLIDCHEILDDKFVHGELLTEMIDALLKRNKALRKELSAISCAIGPGSYTGLRIGLATAKGLAFGLNIPLIGISSLESLVKVAQEIHPNKTYAAAFDARRNEVFLRIQHQNEVLLSDQAMILEPDSLKMYKSLCWIGDANEKIEGILKAEGTTFDNSIHPSAKGQISLARQYIHHGKVDDLRSLTPNYTKDFYSAQNK